MGCARTTQSFSKSSHASSGAEAELLGCHGLAAVLDSDRHLPGAARQEL
jgi:hypothetical protein